MVNNVESYKKWFTFYHDTGLKKNNRNLFYFTKAKLSINEILKYPKNCTMISKVIDLDGIINILFSQCVYRFFQTDYKIFYTHTQHSSFTVSLNKNPTVSEEHNKILSKMQKQEKNKMSTVNFISTTKFRQIWIAAICVTIKNFPWPEVRNKTRRKPNVTSCDRNRNFMRFQ